jgi:hypothetical protein
MAATIVLAPEARRLATKLIEQYHKLLRNATILYLFSDQKPTKAGRPIMARTKKTSPLERFLGQSFSEGDDAGVDYVVIFYAEEWGKLTPAQRLALVDHELCHMTVEYDEDTDEPSWGLQGHDLEEFRAVVQRHGLWQPDIEEFAATVQQLSLQLEVPV